jgi:flagellin
LQGKVNNINAVKDQTGVTASLKAETAGTADLTRARVDLSSSVNGTATGVATLLLNGVSVSIATTDTTVTVMAAINAVASLSGVRAYLDSGTSAAWHLYAEGNATITAVDSAGASGVAAIASVLNATALNITSGSFGSAVSVSSASALDTTAGNTAGSLNINNVNISILGSQAGNISDIASVINQSQATTGVYASVNEKGQLQLNSNAAFSVKAGVTEGAKLLSVLGLQGSDKDPTNTETINPQIQLDSSKGTPISVEVTSTGKTATGFISQNVSSGGGGFGSSIASVSIDTQVNAQAAIKVIDNALTTINDTRANLGAINNRLDFTVSNLSSISEKTTSARSRIVDADFASETANLSRATVLQQAATAMLAQANQRPQNVLSLLR